MSFRTSLRPVILALPVVISTPASCPSNDKTLARPAHHLPNGKGFVNPWPSFIDHSITPSSLLNIWRDWQSKPVPPPELLPQVIPVTWGLKEAATDEEKSDWSDKLKSTWLGHACFLVEFPSLSDTGAIERPRGARVLFDPIFSNRCSPSQYLGPARVTKPPFPLKELPHVDAVILSHNHYDHTDINTLQHIYRSSEKGSTHFFTPLGTKAWFESNGFASEHVTELDWWQERDLTLQLVAGQESTKQDIRIVATPCQHFSGRSINDRCSTLWASWAVVQEEKKGLKGGSVWFGGDTGFKSVPRGAVTEEGLPTCPVFKEIGKKFSSGFDLAMIPIGAYDPRWAMSRVHCNPEDAVELHCDVGSRRSVGGHWGTFILTSEEMTEPPKRLLAATKAKGLKEGEFGVCEIGETVFGVPRKV